MSLDTRDIRRFNRYYTRILGVFDQKVFNLDYSMIEMRIWEKSDVILVLPPMN